MCETKCNMSWESYWNGYSQRVRIFKNNTFDLMVGLTSDLRTYFKLLKKKGSWQQVKAHTLLCGGQCERVCSWGVCWLVEETPKIKWARCQLLGALKRWLLEEGLTKGRKAHFLEMGEVENSWQWRYIFRGCFWQAVRQEAVEKSLLGKPQPS